MKLYAVITGFLVLSYCISNADTDTPFHQEIQYLVYTGPSVYEHAHHVPPLSTALFYDYPYLYAGKAEDEDLEQFLTDRSVAVLAYADQHVVGIAIGTPIHAGNDDAAAIHSLLKHNTQYSPDNSVYVAQVLVDKPYQKRGIARTMMRLFEETAQEMGYSKMYLITVERSENHPFKTDDAPSLERIWQHLGFSKTSLSMPCLWSTRCGTPDQEYTAAIDNMVRLWHKDIQKIESHTPMITIKQIALHQVDELKTMITHAYFDLLQPDQTVQETFVKLQKQGYFNDLDTLQTTYLEGGTFLILLDGEKIVGAGAIRKYSDDICELKRMWFLKEYRGKGLGLQMAQQLLGFAKQYGYKKVRLDVWFPEVQERAIALYKKLGFNEIPAYNTSLAKLFMEKVL